MTEKLKYLPLALVFLTSFATFAQDTLRFVPRPRIGVGTGTMTYFGEVQNYQRGFANTVNRFGGLVYLNAPVSKMFNLEFSASYAKIAANERTLTSNFNFESHIRMGSAVLFYNFHPLFRANRTKFHPFIGAGVASFEFLSKTDLYDANGNKYHYWSDGSIMNMDESDPFSGGAIQLKRDYVYETDLRELNEDGLGKYKEQSFAFPLVLGFEWHLSPRWDFRLATTYYFTLTDMVDNISTAGTGIRNGDKANDRLLFTTASLSYDLQFGSGKKGVGPAIDDEDGIDYYVGWDPNDFDKDGVIDALDKCPCTPLEALVDEHGCPLDTDGDGVPDYMDDEPNTPKDRYVDEYGMTITEDDFSKHMREFYDSTGYEHAFTEERTEVVFSKEKVQHYRRESGKREGLKYVIVVGKEQKDITANDLHKFLGYQEYSTIMKGDTVYYTLGEYNTIEEAVAAKSGLQEKGVNIKNIVRNNAATQALVNVDEKVIEKVEKVNIQEGRVGPDYQESQKLYRVQVGAFKSKVDAKKIFPGIDVVYGASEDNINRYYTGSFNTYEEANEFRNKVKDKGYTTAFVVAYEQQKRVTLKDAGIPEKDLPENYSEEKELSTFVEPREEKLENGENNVSITTYRVQLGHFKGEIPVETVDILYNLKNVKPVKHKDGATTYYSKSFKTAKERDDALIEFATYGLENMLPVYEVQGIIYTEAEYQELNK